MDTMGDAHDSRTAMETPGVSLDGLEQAVDNACVEIDRLREGLVLRDFSYVNRQRCESPDGFNHALHSWSLSDWFTAVVGELGEAANIAKKLNRVRDGIPGNKEAPDQLRDKLARELADTFIYLDLLAQAADVDLPSSIVRVFNAKSDELGCSIRYAHAHASAGLPVAREAGCADAVPTRPDGETKHD